MAWLQQREVLLPRGSPRPVAGIRPRPVRHARHRRSTPCGRYECEALAKVTGEGRSGMDVIDDGLVDLVINVARTYDELGRPDGDLSGAARWMPRCHW